MEKLVNITQLSEATGVSVRSLRTLVEKRAVPFLKVGHRTMSFQPDKVAKALEKFEVRAIR